MSLDSQAYPISPYPQPAGTGVVAWRTTIGGAAYTFVALHVRGRGWYVTGQIYEALSWDALCYLLPPEDGRFLVLGVAGQITSAFPAGAPQ